MCVLDLILKHFVTKLFQDRVLTTNNIYFLCFICVHTLNYYFFNKKNMNLNKNDAKVVTLAASAEQLSHIYEKNVE